MFENIMKFFKKMNKKDEKVATNSRDAAKERLHLVLMQDRANVSADFLELMKQEIIEVIKKYIEVDEADIDVRLTNKENEDGTNGAPALYANIPILNIKNEARKIDAKANKEENKKEDNKKEDNEKTEKPEKEENKKNSKDKKEETKVIIDNDEEKEESKKEEIVEAVIDNEKEKKEKIKKEEIVEVVIDNKKENKKIQEKKTIRKQSI